jgi:hypothetical protein
MELIINHIQGCKLFSVDTESDCDNTKEIALIEFHCIPTQLPSFVLLIELNHLPPFNTELFKQIYLLFHSLFRLGNAIYSWGPPIDELKKALRFHPFSFPLHCKCEDLRRCQCEILPHIGIIRKWPLQNAIRYT